MYYGDIPSGFTTLASCDSNYLRLHAPSLISSCALSDNDLHLHVVNATDSDWAYMQELRIRAGKLNGKDILTLSSENTDLSKLSVEEKRTYYACNRFLVAHQLLEFGSGSLFISDVDSLFMRHVNEPDADIGLFLREPLPGTSGWESEGTRIAAGAVYYHKDRAKIFASQVANIITTNDLRWFLDQFALSTIYRKMESELKLHTYTLDFMDWEFTIGTNIWTGKGNRKYDNERYVGKKKEFENMLPSLEKSVWQ